MSGIKSKVEGKYFERMLEHMALRSGYSVTQIPTGARVASMKPRIVLIPTKTPYDFILVKGLRVIFLDAKSNQGKTFPYGLIKKHQVEKLLEMENHGHTGGYLVCFRELDQTVFFKASILNKLSPRKSLLPENGQIIGTASRFNLDLI